MAEFTRNVTEADVIARARAIVGRHTLPDFFSDFDIRLGQLDDRPTLVVVYHSLRSDYELTTEQVLHQSAEYGQLDNVVLPELLDEFEDRVPYSFII